MTRRIAVPDALAALCSLLLTVLLLCQTAVSAAGEAELGGGGTSREADSLPESPDEPGSPGESGPTGDPGSPNEPGLLASPADSSWDDRDPLDEPPPSRNRGRLNNRPSAATPAESGSAASRVLPRSPTHAAPPPGPPGQPPAARLPVLQVFRL